MPPLLIDRSIDQEKYWKNATDLDRIASMILAVAWSGGNPQGKQAQGNVSLRTVAVVSIDNRRLIVASNAVATTDSYVIKFNPNQCKSQPNYYYKLEGFTKGNTVFSPQQAIRAMLVANGEYRSVEFPPECENGFDFHAEMALLEYLSERDLHPDDKLIGVSKPCCRYCCRWLSGCGMNFSFHHRDPVGQWREPNIPPGWKP